MEPHPFWIPVLLLGLQYGTVSGLVAAGAAIAATLFGGLPEGGIGENHFAYFLRVWGQPILWIAMALLVGQFRMRQIAVKQELRLVGEQLARQRDDLAHHAGGLRARCEMLERELAGRRDAAPHRALARFAALERQGRGALRQAALTDAIGAAFPGGRARLYLQGDGELVEHVDGDDSARAMRRVIPRGHPLDVAVVSGGSSLSVLDANGERKLDGYGLVAVPVPGRGGSGTGGMLVLEQAAPEAISPDGIAALEAIARAVSAGIDAALPIAAAPPIAPQHEAADRTATPLRHGLRLLAGNDAVAQSREDVAGHAADAAVER